MKTRRRRVECTSDYSFGHMFKPTHWDAYCSLGSFNVHVFGLLQRFLVLEDDVVENMRSFIIRRTRFAARHVFGDEEGADTERWSMPELEVFITDLWAHYTSGTEIGRLLFHEEVEDADGVRRPTRAAPAEVRRVADLVDRIQRSRFEPTVTVMRALDAKFSVLEAPYVQPPVGIGGTVKKGWCAHAKHSVMGFINAVAVSRVGQFSCPVSCGAVLLGCASTQDELRTKNLMSATAVSGGPCAVMDSMTMVEDVIQASADGRLPRIVAVRSTSAGDYVEFAPSVSSAEPDPKLLDLRPLVWFKFITKEEARANAAADGRRATMVHHFRGQETEKWDVLRMNLTHLHAGNVLCGKLICAENHMAEWNDNHDKPNIDINALMVFGAMCHPWH